MGRKNKPSKHKKPRQAKIFDFLPTKVMDTCLKCEETRKPNSRHTNRQKVKRTPKKRLISDPSSDSAFDTASISSEPNSLSSDVSTDLLLSSDAEELTCKIAKVSIKDIERKEKRKELEQLSEHLNGTPLIQYSTNDSCTQCLSNFLKAEHGFQHYLMQFYGIEDSFNLDSTSSGIEDIHVNLFPLGYNDLFYRGICQAYIAPSGSMYYINKEPHLELSTLPKETLIPPYDLPCYEATAPPPRQWIHERHHLGSPSQKAHFTVMCYNVLCDKFCPTISATCPSWSLNWDFRKRSIVEEILLHDPSILALQEIESQQFHEFFSAELSKAGYVGVFCAKSRYRTMQLVETQTVDGCAIFWKSTKFEKVDERSIEFDQLAIANAEGSENILNRVMTRDNVGLCVLLRTKPDIWQNGEPKRSSVPVLVSTAHFVSDPAYSDVKLIQSLMLLSELRLFAQQHTDILGSEYADFPFILTGDLNSLPDSGVIEFLSSGYIEGHHPDFRSIDYQQVLKSFSHSHEDNLLSHPFNLTSAYQGLDLPFTNYTYDFQGILDYIFYSNNRHVRLIDTLGPYEEDWYNNNGVGSCPHPHIPSDHISLLAKFELTSSSS